MGKRKHRPDEPEEPDEDLMTGEPMDDELSPAPASRAVARRDDDNPAEHVDLFAPSTQVLPSSADALTTAVSQVRAVQLPKTLAESMLPASAIGIAVDHQRFRANRPQAHFVRLPWPLATRDPDFDPKDDRAIWWYAAGIHDGVLYLEGMRGPNVKALAKALAFAPPRVRASDLVPDLTGQAPTPGVERGARNARGAGARPPGTTPDGAQLPAVTVPDDCELVFRQMVEGEVIGKWRLQDVAKYVILETWGLHSHPEYLKMKQTAHGWEETKADGLYEGHGHPTLY